MVGPGGFPEHGEVVLGEMREGEVHTGKDMGVEEIEGALPVEGGGVEVGVVGGEGEGEGLTLEETLGAVEGGEVGGEVGGGGEGGEVGPVVLYGPAEDDGGVGFFVVLGELGGRELGDVEGGDLGECFTGVASLFC